MFQCAAIKNGGVRKVSGRSDNLSKVFGGCSPEYVFVRVSGRLVRVSDRYEEFQNVMKSVRPL